MTMLFQGVSSFFFTLATPFSLLFLLVGINALVVALQKSHAHPDNCTALPLILSWAIIFL